MKYIIFIIVLYASFYSTLSDDRKWYYIDSVEIDGKMEKIKSSFIVVDSLNNKYFIDGEGRVIKYDNIRFTRLKIDEKYSAFSALFFPDEYQLDIDNSHWWITSTPGPNILDSYYIIHYNNNKMTKYSIDSIFLGFGISTDKSRAIYAYGICIDYNGIKHFLTDYGIVSFDNNTFSIDTTFFAMQDSIKANNKYVIPTKLFLSSNNSLLYIFGITDYKTNSKNFEIFEKTEDTWKHLTSIKIEDMRRYLTVDRTGKFIYLVHGDYDWMILLKVYDLEKNEWNYYKFPGNQSHTGLAQTADFDSRNHFWYHQSATANKYIFIFENNTGQISSFNYPENIPYFILHSISSMRFDKSDNLWCSSRLNDSAIFVYAKENPLSTKNKNIEENLSLSISPHPVTEKLTLINIPDNATEFEIYDQFGNRQIAGLISGQIDVTLLPAGVYFIKLNNSLRPLKFIKI